MSSGSRTKTEEPVVLVVDDFEDTLLLYASALRDAGFIVETAVNGDEAIAQAAKLQPHVILMDMSMPGTDGWEATRRIRESEGRAAFIVAVTAAAGSESRKQAFDVGCDAFIAKPCTPDVVVTAVRGMLHPPNES